MERRNKKGMKICSSRVLLAVILLLGGLTSASAYKQTYNVNVGETFTVYTTYKSYTQSVLWTYDYNIVQPVGYFGSAATSVTFKAVAASPSVGSVIQAVTYYYQNGTTYSGMNKYLDDWKVTVTDNSRVSLNQTSITMNPGDTEYIRATPSNSSYSGRYNWSSSNSSVAYVSGSSSSVRIIAQSSGSTTITVRLDNGNSAQCNVTVRTIDVSSASVYPSYKYLAIDESSTLSVSVSPSNATVTSRSWRSSNSGIASVNSSGVVTGVSEGTTEIYCVVNGNVTSSSCSVTVSKPSFTLNSSAPSDNSTGQSVFIHPSLTFCRTIYRGGAFSNITLKDSGGKTINGTISTNGSTLAFVPSVPLAPNTSYTLVVPPSAVCDRYGNENYAITRTFTTGDLQKITIKASTSERFLSKGEKITLSTNAANVSIYYTLDGTIPTDKSAKYQQAIEVNCDIRLRAIAMGAGYETSDVLSVDYYISNVDVVRRFPDGNTQMYEYKDVNPHVTYSNSIISSDNIGNVQLIKDGMVQIEGEVIVSDSSIFFVPNIPLELGCSYQMIIPADAVRTVQGESNDATSWTFSTGDFATTIVMNGPELGAVTKTDGSMLTWGSLYQTGNSANGSYTAKQQLTPAIFMNDVSIRQISSGYMHHAIVKNDNSLWMWGRQYCGEFGNNSTAGTSMPIKIMDDVLTVSCGGQTTAILKTDGTLWMCGRNDFGQIGDSSIVIRSEPVKIMSDVSSAAAGWCVTYAVKNDGSLWAWGRNNKHQLGIDGDEERLAPVKIMDDVAIVATSATESKWAVAIKTDGTLWAWGEIQAKPTQLLGGVSSVAVGADYVAAVKNDGTLWAFGDNEFGQLGNNTDIASAAPFKVMDDVSQVASGGQTTMINMRNGSVWTWGRNHTGLLGDGSEPSMTACIKRPTQIVEGRSAASLQGVTSNQEVYNLSVGQRKVIDAKPIPLNAMYNKVTWRSDDKSIVSVNERGIIQGEAFGETTVSAVIKDSKGKEYGMTCLVTVSNETAIPLTHQAPPRIMVWFNRHRIHAAGLQDGQLMQVYRTDGKLVYQATSNGNLIISSVMEDGVYVIKAGTSTLKVLNR